MALYSRFTGREQGLVVCSCPAKGCAFAIGGISWPRSLRYCFKKRGLSLTLRSARKNLRKRALMQHCTLLCDLHNWTIRFELSFCSMYVVIDAFVVIGSDLESKKLTQSYWTADFLSRWAVVLVLFFFLVKIQFDFAKNLPNFSL